MMPSGQKRSYTKTLCKFKTRLTGKHICTRCLTGRAEPLPVNSFHFSLSSEKIQSLHTELDSVQALRAQLEEVLGRSRSVALEMERAAESERRHDYGGGDGQSPASWVVGDSRH